MEGGAASAAGGSTIELEWQCPSCTLLNKSSSFKCRMCGTPKGTSTRQLKRHSAAIEKQYVAETLTKQLQSNKHYSKAPPTSTTPTTSLPVPGPEDSKRKTTPTNTSKSKGTNKSYPTLSNIDRTTGRSYRVTVDSVTTVITEYDFMYPPSD